VDIGRGVLVILVLLQSNFGLSADSAATSKTSSKVSVEKAEDTKKKKIGVDQSDFMPAANKFGLIATYNTSYNSLEQTDLKTYRHRLNFAGTYSFSKSWSSYAAIGVSHESTGDKIVRENDSDPFHEFSNANVGVVFSKMKPIRYIRRSSNTLNIGLPVSRRSRVDKHVANISLTNFLQSYSWNRFSLFNRLTGNYLWQTQKYSLFLNDRLNRDLLVSNSFGATYMPLQRLGVRVSLRADGTRYLDSSWDMTFGNNVSLFANYFGCQFFAALINNSYQENERIDLGYYDKYRKIYLAGVTYVF